jgi:hypothetical protein
VSDKGMCGAVTDSPYGTAICELEPGHDGPHHSTVAEIPERRSLHEHPIGYDWTDDGAGV